jgi:Predicted metal-binding protein related to the C-terminal domain of SecA
MSNKIGRNDPCPCGSGKKYKKCCYGREDNLEYSNPANFARNYKEMRKAARIKECIYPDHSSCSEKIIKAHSIQNNKILAKISDDGKVYMPVFKPEISFEFQQEYGRKEASVFTGFCGYHDKTVFQPIEDHDFTGSTEQIFLYIYRAFALEYHRKLEDVRMYQQMFRNQPSSAKELTIDGKITPSLSVKDLLEEKAVFDKALLSKQYDVLTSIVWTFDGFSNFAATGGETPVFDFDGKKIQDLSNPNIPVRNIYYSVFPENNKTFAIVAWLKEYDSLFSSMKKRLNEVSEQEKRNYINNTLALFIENIAIKPSSWKALPKKAKDDFAMMFYTPTNLMKFDRFKKRSFDLFSL